MHEVTKANCVQSISDDFRRVFESKTAATNETVVMISFSLFCFVFWGGWGDPNRSLIKSFSTTRYFSSRRGTGDLELSIALLFRRLSQTSILVIRPLLPSSARFGYATKGHHPVLLASIHRNGAFSIACDLSRPALFQLPAFLSLIHI